MSFSSVFSFLRDSDLHVFPALVYPVQKFGVHHHRLIARGGRSGGDDFGDIHYIIMVPFQTPVFLIPVAYHPVLILTLYHAEPVSPASVMSGEDCFRINQGLVLHGPVGVVFVIIYLVPERTVFVCDTQIFVDV